MTHGPGEGAVPATETTQVQLDPGQRADVTFSPENSGTEVSVPVLAISRQDGTTYEVTADGTDRFGQSAIPPSEPANLAQCFIPPMTFSEDLVVTIRNTGTATKTYSVEMVGWEGE